MLDAGLTPGIRHARSRIHAQFAILRLPCSVERAGRSLSFPRQANPHALRCRPPRLPPRPGNWGDDLRPPPSSRAERQFAANQDLAALHLRRRAGPSLPRRLRRSEQPRVDPGAWRSLRAVGAPVYATVILRETLMCCFAARASHRSPVGPSVVVHRYHHRAPVRRRNSRWRISTW